MPSVSSKHDGNGFVSMKEKNPVARAMSIKNHNSCAAGTASSVLNNEDPGVLLTSFLSPSSTRANECHISYRKTNGHYSQVFNQSNETGHADMRRYNQHAITTKSNINNFSHQGCNSQPSRHVYRSLPPRPQDFHVYSNFPRHDDLPLPQNRNSEYAQHVGSRPIYQNQNETSFHRHNKEQPRLLHLDPRDLNLIKFQYPVKLGVTMIGTGENCVQAPDIVVHGSEVAPQHCFLERLSSDEVTLHSISDATTLNDVSVAQPRILTTGSLISVGKSHFFRYVGSGRTNEIAEESPYAVIRPKEKKLASLVKEQSPYCSPFEYSMEDSRNGNGSFSTGCASSPSMSFGEDVPSPRNSSTSNSTYTSSIDAYEDHSRKCSNLGQVDGMEREAHQRGSNGNHYSRREVEKQYFECSEVLSEYKSASSGHSTRIFCSDDPRSDRWTTGTYVNGNFEAKNGCSYGALLFPHDGDSTSFDSLEDFKFPKKDEKKEYKEERMQLDELLAMCEEYERRFSKELSNTDVASKKFEETNIPNMPGKLGVNGQSWSLDGNGGKHSSNPGSHNYSKIKTNGSLPRSSHADNEHGNHATMNGHAKSPSSVKSNHVTDEELSAIFTFSSCSSVDDSFLNSSSLGSEGTIFRSMEEKLSSTPKELSPNPLGDSITPSQAKRLEKVPHFGSNRTSCESENCVKKGDPSFSSSSSSSSLSVSGYSSQSQSISSNHHQGIKTDKEIEKQKAELFTSPSTTRPKLSVSFSNQIKHIDDADDRIDSTGYENAMNVNGSIASSRDDSSPPWKRALDHPVTQVATQVDVHVSESEELSASELSSSTVNSREPTSSNDMIDLRLVRLQKELKNVEMLEREALRELEIEKALLGGEKGSLQNQIESDRREKEMLQNRLEQAERYIETWREDMLERIKELHNKLSNSEIEWKRLDALHRTFIGSTDDELVLLERLKFQHELVENDRKSFEDAEFRLTEQEVEKESQIDELKRRLEEVEGRLDKSERSLERLNGNISTALSPSIMEVKTLEKERQRIMGILGDNFTLKGSGDSKYLVAPEMKGKLEAYFMKSTDIDEQLRELALLSPADEDALRIERIKSRSPIDPKLGTGSSKSTETLKRIEKDREYLLSEHGVRILEDERESVKQLQKRVQDAVRVQWEKGKRTREAQCESLNSVGSEDTTSFQSISDSHPTDSPVSSTDVILEKKEITSESSGAEQMREDELRKNREDGDMEEKMRQRAREMTHGKEEARPMSEASAVEPGTVTMRQKNSTQNRPLTRYLPVRGDEDHFDLRGHIESSGHQLELCPQIIVTCTSARGFLSKLGSRFHNWNKRWFLFDRETRTLSYYLDKNEKKSRGGVHFQAIQEVYIDHLQSVKSPHPKLTFCVKTYNRTFHLVAPSAETMRIWMDVIFTGAEGYQEYLNT